MCFVLYMASDRVRRTILWDEKQPQFHVKADDADARKTRSQFTKQNIYYIGSSDSCGCGFRREPDWVLDQGDGEEKRSKQENQRHLHAYLRECLQDEDEIELFGCWSGEEGQQADTKRAIFVDELITQEFFFDERERILVKRSAHVAQGARES